MELLKFLIKCGIEVNDEVKEKIKQAQGTFLNDYVKKSEFDNKETELNVFKEQVSELSKSLETSKSDFETYKANLVKEKDNEVKRNLLTEKFKANGLMNDNLISLLTKNIDLETIELKDNDIVDFSKIIDPIKQDYKDFFGEVKIEGTPPKVIDPITPPSPKVTLESINNMTEQEINENWDMVQAVLQAQ